MACLLSNQSTHRVGETMLVEKQGSVMANKKHHIFELESLISISDVPSLSLVL
jgi:hypothetical protein